MIETNIFEIKFVAKFHALNEIKNNRKLLIICNKKTLYIRVTLLCCEDALRKSETVDYFHLRKQRRNILPFIAVRWKEMFLSN